MMRRTPSSWLTALAVAAAALVRPAPVVAQTAVDFESLPQSSALGSLIPGGYQGLQSWGFGYISTNQTLAFADATCRSGITCAFNGSATGVGTTNSAPFTMEGWIRGWAAAFANNPTATSVKVETWLGGSSTGWSLDIALSSTTWTSFSLSSSPSFDEIRWTPSSAQQAGKGWFLLDDVTLNPRVVPPSQTVPEPSTVALVAAGLAGVVVARRRRAVRGA